MTALAAVLTLLVGATLMRLVGPSAGGVTFAALFTLVQSYRRRRRERRRALIASLRAEDPRLREPLLQAIENVRERHAIGTALEREGMVTQLGRVESFPFPRSFQRNLKARYWWTWTLGAGVLGIAAILPAMPAMYRVALLIGGCYFTYRIVRVSKWQRLLAAWLEVAPSGVSVVAPDGGRVTIAFVPPVSLHQLTGGDMLVVAHDGRRSIRVSRNVVGFNRLVDLLTTYSGASVGEPASPS